MLLNCGEPGVFDIGPWADRVVSIDATYHGEWEPPLLGELDAPAAVLIPGRLRRLDRNAHRPRTTERPVEVDRGKGVHAVGVPRSSGEHPLKSSLVRTDEPRRVGRGGDRSEELLGPRIRGREVCAQHD